MNPTLFLQTLGGNSLQGAVLVVLVLSVQGCFRRHLTPGWRCALWLVVVVRLLLPVSANSTVSIYNLAPDLRPALNPEAAPPALSRVDPVLVTLESSAVDNRLVGGGAADGARVEGAPADRALPPLSTQSNAHSQMWPQVFFCAWILGAGVMATRLLVRSLDFARRVRGTACTDPEVTALLAECTVLSGVRRAPVLLESDAVSAPAVFGLLRPSLLMPSGFRSWFTPKELRYIFLHELAHIRRRDLIVNGLMALIQVVHWFNPLVWFGFARWRLDRELACDAFALDVLGGTHQRDYGETIIRLLQQPPAFRFGPGLIGISEGPRQLKRRILQIARFSPTRRWSMLAVVLLGAIAAVGLTDAQEQKPAIEAATSTPDVPAAGPSALATPANLGRVHPLTIVVKDAVTHRPVPGAKVSSYGLSEEAVTDDTGVTTLSIPVDLSEAGRFQKFQVGITSPQHSARQVMWIAASGGVLATLPRQHEVNLSPGISVGGVVRDERGAPVAGARIFLSGANYTGFRLNSGVTTHQEYSHVYTGENDAPETDSQGGWRHDRFPEDLSKLTITVVRPSGARATFVAGDERVAPGTKATPIDLDAMKAGNVVLTLKDGVTVHGRVTDEAGATLAGVQLRARDAATRNPPFRFTTDSAGLFELADWDAASVLITAERAGYRTTSVTYHLHADAPALKIVLGPAKPLRLRVLGENGEPVVQAEVRTDPNPSPTQIVDWWAVTDAEGRAVWPTAPDVPVDLWLSSKHYPHRTAKLTSGDDEHIIRLRHGTDKAISVHLRVVDAETGQPVPAFEVWRRMSGGLYTPWGEPAAQGEFRRQIAMEEFRKGIVEAYRLQVRAAGYTGWNSEVIAFSNGDQNLVVKLTQGESAVAAEPSSVRAGGGMNGETHPGLIPLAASVARLLETGDVAAFVQATVATPKDWESLPAMAERLKPSQVKRREAAVAASAEHVLEIARKAGLASGSIRFQVKSVGCPLNSSTSTSINGKTVSFPYARALTVILVGEPAGDGGGRPLRGDYQLSFGNARETPGGWRSDDGIRWQTLPPGLAGTEILRELRLANQIAPADPVGVTLSGADDTSLLQFGETVIALLKSRTVSPFVSAATFSPAEAKDFFQRFGRGPAAGLTISAQATVDLQERLGLDFTDAKLTVRQVLAERPSFSRFGELDGILAGPIRVSFAVESPRRSKSGASLAGNYVVALDQVVRTNERWYLISDKLRWQEFPQALVAGGGLEQIAFENHVAENGTLPPGFLAPGVRLESLSDGAAVNLSSYRGKVVVLEFWASWCGPCQEPMDKLQQLVAEHPEWKDRVEVIALSIDGTLKDAQEHLAKKAWNNTTNRWAGAGGFKSAAARDFRLRGVPTVYVLGADGKVAAAGHPASLYLAGLVRQQLATQRP